MIWEKGLVEITGNVDDRVAKWRRKLDRAIAKRKPHAEMWKKTEEYIIVGSTEADPFEGKISNESPLGRALLNHKAGDRVQVEAPAGAFVVTIHKVE